MEDNRDAILIGDRYSHGDNEIVCNTRNYSTESSPSIKLPFPKQEILFIPTGDSNMPRIVLEDWTDQSYFDYHGCFIEDKSGTGIYKIIENHPPCLNINGQFYSVGANIFNLDKNTIKEAASIEITFKDCHNGEIKFKDLELENVGPYAVRYYWKRIRRYENMSFPIKFSPNHEQKFYFDSRPGILVPGEKRKLGIGLKSKFTGVYKEDWKFIAFPAVHTNDIIFKFRALSSEKVATEPWREFDRKLNWQQATENATSILNYIVRKVFEETKPLSGPEVVDYKTEESAFLHNNSDMFSFKQEVVNNLKDIHLTLFEEDWKLNVFDFEQNLERNNTFISPDKIVTFKKLKIDMIKSETNLLPRQFYKKYNDIFQALGDTINGVQTVIDKSRPKHGLKPIPPIVELDRAPYYYFPLSSSQLDATDDLQNKKLPKGKSLDKGRANGKGKTGDNNKDKDDKSKGKRREMIEIVPKKTPIVQLKQWTPENRNYGDDVYEKVYNALCKFFEKFVDVLEDFKDEPTSQSSIKGLSSTYSQNKI